MKTPVTHLSRCMIVSAFNNSVNDLIMTRFPCSLTHCCGIFPLHTLRATRFLSLASSYSNHLAKNRLRLLKSASWGGPKSGKQCSSLRQRQQQRLGEQKETGRDGKEWSRRGVVVLRRRQKESDRQRICEHAFLTLVRQKLSRPSETKERRKRPQVLLPLSYSP